MGYHCTQICVYNYSFWKIGHGVQQLCSKTIEPMHIYKDCTYLNYSIQNFFCIIHDCVYPPKTNAIEFIILFCENWSYSDCMVHHYFFAHHWIKPNCQSIALWWIHIISLKHELLWAKLMQIQVAWIDIATYY